MGLMDWFKHGVGEMMVARPDDAKAHVVWKHPDPTIPMKSQLTVESDEKAVFFRKLAPGTTDATVRALLERFGPLDYCYVARDPGTGASKRIGRAKFRPVAVPAEDAGLGSKGRRILRARQRAVDNAAAACAALDRTEVDGATIRVEGARPADMKEYSRYGDY